VIEVNYEPTLELLPIITHSKVGDSNMGMKIIHVDKNDEKFLIYMEGIAGKTYELTLKNTEFVKDVTGATLIDNKLIITIPKNKSGEFVNHQVTIHLLSNRTD
jgi:hypothetical protein